MRVCITWLLSGLVVIGALIGSSAEGDSSDYKQLQGKQLSIKKWKIKQRFVYEQKMKFFKSKTYFNE